MNAVRKNKLFTILIAALRSVALLCATGTLMQTFLSVLGFDSTWIYIQITLLQASNVLTILLCSRWADRGNVMRRAAMSLISAGVLILCYLPLCVWREASFGAYLFLLAVSMLQSVTTGLYSVCEYKVPYYVYRAEDYGAVMAAVGIASSVVSFAAGALVSALTAVFSYVDIMAVAFAVAAGFMLIGGVLQCNMTALIPVDEAPKKGEKDEQDQMPLKDVLLAPVFRDLLGANLMRGIANGTISVLTVMAISLGFGETVVTAMVPVSSVAMLVAYVFFGFYSHRLGPRNIAFIGSVCILALMLMLVPDNMVFLAAYAVVSFGKVIVDNAVPAALLRAVPVKIAGPYNAWRMVLHYGGTLLGTAVAAVIPVPIMLGVTAVLQLLSGWMYRKAKAMDPI